MIVPLTIKFISDNNELVFQNVIKGTNIYKYTVSETKKGNLLGLTDAEIEKLLKNKTICAMQ